MASEGDRPTAVTAKVHILFNGYVDFLTGVSPFSVAPTIAFVRDGDFRVVIDPGMVPSPRSILDPLEQLGESAAGVTDVVFSHHHPDHTLHAALFPNAQFHDLWAIYKGDTWTARPAEGFDLSPSIRLIQTPGHTPQDITTLVATTDGVTAFTHLWWTAQGPDVDPFASDMGAIRAGRQRVLKVASLIVPGHGAPFTPGPDTPR